MLFMASLSCSSWWAEFKASNRMSVSSLSFTQSSERKSDTILSPSSPSSALSMILTRKIVIIRWLIVLMIKCIASEFWGVCRYLHTGWSRSRCFQGWRVLTPFSALMSHLWRIGSWWIRGGNFLNVWVGFGSFLYAESLVKGASQLNRNRNVKISE